MLFGALGQSRPSAATLVDCYTVPTGRRATASVLTCNQGGATTVRVSHASGGAADSLEQYVLYDSTLAANTTSGTMRLSLAAGDVVRVYSASGTVAFNVNGIEEDG